MSVNEWLLQFKSLHDRARKGQLSASERSAYLAAREQMARSLTTIQGLSIKPGETARQAFRVAQAVQVELTLPLAQLKTVTLDLSRGGFSAVIGSTVAPAESDSVPFSLKLPGGEEPLTGTVKVIATKRQPGNVRVSFAFKDMSEKDQDRLEFALFDMALARLNIG